jgi:hypothetical protein
MAVGNTKNQNQRFVLEWELNHTALLPLRLRPALNLFFFIVLQLCYAVMRLCSIGCEIGKYLSFTLTLCQIRFTDFVLSSEVHVLPS